MFGKGIRYRSERFWIVTGHCYLKRLIWLSKFILYCKISYYQRFFIYFIFTFLNSQIRHTQIGIVIYFTFCLGCPPKPFHLIFWDGKNGLKMVLNGLKIVCKHDVRIVWLCWFWGSMNGWDLKILYRDLKSWKKWKNGMEWNGRNG